MRVAEDVVCHRPISQWSASETEMRPSLLGPIQVLATKPARQAVEFFGAVHVKTAARIRATHVVAYRVADAEAAVLRLRAQIAAGANGHRKHSRTTGSRRGNAEGRRATVDR